MKSIARMTLLCGAVLMGGMTGALGQEGSGSGDLAADRDRILSILLADPACDQETANLIADSSMNGIQRALETIQDGLSSPLLGEDMFCLDQLMNFNLDILVQPPGLAMVDQILNQLRQQISEQICGFVNEATGIFNEWKNIDLPGGGSIGINSNSSGSGGSPLFQGFSGFCCNG